MPPGSFWSRNGLLYLTMGTFFATFGLSRYGMLDVIRSAANDR